MSSGFFLGAYWPARKESIEQCADRLRLFFADLATCDPALATWYNLGRSRKKALEKRADVGNLDGLLTLLNKGRHRRDMPRTVIEELGFSVGLWNGREEGKDVGLGITCGLYWVSPTPNASLSNCVTLNLPEDLGELKQVERMTRVLAVVARAWQPEWAGAMSRGAMNLRDFKSKKPFVDWMLYVSKSLMPRVPALPKPSTVRAVDGIGSIIVVQDEPPDPTNPEHVRNIQQVESAIL